MSALEKIIAGKKVGVYCLGNDEFIEWFQMFVRSLRHFNPTLPLTVIPYDTRVTRLQKLTSQFNFDLVPEAEAARFDALESRVMGQGRYAGMFRKWASFFGPYDEFIFLDADIAVTMPLDELFAAFGQSPFDLVYFDADITNVYEPEHIAGMQLKYHSVGFNAGAFMSRKGAVTGEQLWRTAEAAAAERPKLKRNHVDQPFLNYVFDTLPRRTTQHITLLPKLARIPWARARFQYDARHDRMVDAEGRQMPFVHWAGCHYLTLVRPEIFLKYRLLGLSFPARLRCRLNFYYRRSKRRLKNILQQFPTTTRLVKLRERFKKK